MSNIEWASGGGSGEGEAGNVNCNDTLSKKRYSGTALYTKTKPINVKYGMGKRGEQGGGSGEGEAGNVNCNDTLSKKKYSGTALYTKTKPINVKY